MGEFKVPRNEDRSAKGNTYILKPHPIFKDKYLLHDGKPYSNKEAYRNIEKISHHAHFIVGAKHNGQWYKLHDQGDTPISVHEKDLNGNTHKIEEMKDFRNLVKTTYAGLLEVEGLNETSSSKYERHMKDI